MTAALLSVAGLAGAALAATLVPPPVPHPVAVGPVSGENGFPVSYADSSGVRLVPAVGVGDRVLRVRHGGGDVAPAAAEDHLVPVLDRPVRERALESFG
jgi:hypothetical protein